MDRIQLQGRVSTMRDVQRAALARFSTIAIADFDQLRADLNSRVHVGPSKPNHLRPEFSQDAESIRYWKLAADLKRYGQCEYRATGTLWLGDAFGF